MKRLKIKFHPILFLHLFGWGLFSAYKFWGEDLSDWEINLILLTDILTNMAVFYFIYSFLCPRIQGSGQIWLTLLAVPLGAFSFVFLRYFIQEILMPATLGFANYGTPELNFYFRDNILRGSATVIIPFIIFLLEKVQQNKRKSLRLEAAKTKAELSFLRSQVNPHFLFNTLSFLHTQAFTVDKELAANILKLSDILRYAIQNDQVKKRSLEEEVELLKNYIALLEKRFENRCFYTFNINGAPLDQQIEPFLLIPFVENAFKHGHYINPETPIKIQLDIMPGELVFSCSNHIKRQQKDQSTGIGLVNTRKRLSLLYPDQHQLQVREDQYIFQVQLSLTL